MNFRRAGMVTAIALTCINITITQPARADINDDMNAWDVWVNSERALSKLSDIQLELRMQRELERMRENANSRPLPPIQRPPLASEHYPTVNDTFTADPSRPSFNFPSKP